jgi:hypothetical protein
LSERQARIVGAPATWWRHWPGRKFVSVKSKRPEREVFLMIGRSQSGCSLSTNRSKAKNAARRRAAQSRRRNRVRN